MESKNIRLLLLLLILTITSTAVFNNTRKNSTNQHNIGKEGTEDVKKDSTNQHNIGKEGTEDVKKDSTNQHNIGKEGTEDVKKDSTNQHKPNSTNQVSDDVAYPLGFTISEQKGTVELQGNMYIDLALGAGFGLGNAINITNTLTGTTEFAGVTGGSTQNRSGSAQDSNSVSANSDNLIGINFNAGIGYELIVQAGHKVNFYTALGFSYNMIGGNSTSVSNGVNANVADEMYLNDGSFTHHITYDSESTSTTNISQADLLHIVGAKVKLGMSMLQDRLKVYGIVGLGALLPVHVTGNIGINNNVGEGSTGVYSGSTFLSGNSAQPSESLQQDNAANLNLTTANTAFLPSGGIGISYDIVPRRLAVFFEFEGMPVINTAGTAVLNSNTFTNTGVFRSTSSGTVTDQAQVTNTVTNNTTTSNGLTALFMLRTGIKLGF